jgi:hypothetical protein
MPLVLLLDIAGEVPQHFCGFGDRRSWILCEGC